MRVLVLTSVSSILLFSAAAGANAAPAADAAAGKIIFEEHCALCHGFDGGGGRGPNLRRPTLSRAADDEALKSLIEGGIPPEMPDGSLFSKEDIANLAAFVRSLGNVQQEKLPGDAARGEALYRLSGCAGCHIHAGEGVGLGPDLTEIGAKRGPGRLRETLRSPAKAIPVGFLLVEAVTQAGETLRGIRLNEDSFTIQIKDMQSRIYSLRKSELRELKKLRNETPMPSYEGLLSAAEMEDLVAFLAAQRGQP
ncbi:MAG TPA: c-type cytochrome [Bryobacteraceae bacterium]|nr:c-type cytochrome [Bryobacteraceae bacterium]